MRRKKGRVTEQKWYKKMSRGKRSGKARATLYFITSEKIGIEEKERIEKKMSFSKENRKNEATGRFGSAQN